jgi:asparagine synthetase B (glutamine-hydrolysing)
MGAVSSGELLDVVDDLFAFCCNGEIYRYIEFQSYRHGSCKL